MDWDKDCGEKEVSCSRFRLLALSTPVMSRLAASAFSGIFQRMVFAELKPQMEQLPHGEMLKALAFLKSRLRAETPGNRDELARLHQEMDAGRKVSWDDLKAKLGLA